MITINRDALGLAVSRVKAAAQGKSVADNLRCVLLVGAHDRLTVSATNTFTRIEWSAPCAGEGRWLVGVDRLAGIVGKLPEGGVTLDSKGDSLVVKAGKTKYTLPILDASSFPAWPDEDVTSQWEARGTDMAETLSTVRAAVTRDNNRAGLNGVYLDAAEGGGRVVATDGARMHCAEFTTTQPVEPLSRALLSKEFVDALKSAADTDDTWLISVHGRYVTAVGPDCCISARLVDGEFPDYTQVLPRDNDHVIAWTADAADLSAALRRVLVVANERNHTITVRAIDGGIELSAQDVEGGAVTDELAAEIVGADDPVSLNASFLLEAVAVLAARGAKRVTVKKDSGYSRIFVGGTDVPGAFAMIMPIRGNAS